MMSLSRRHPAVSGPTRWSHARTAALATALLLASACSSSSGTGGGGGGGGGIPLESLQSSYITAFCGVIDRCGSQGGFGPLTFSSKEVCVATMSASGQFEVDEVADVAAGKLVYNADQASACLAALNGLKCGGVNDLDELAPSCEKVFSGALAIDAECTDDEHCKDGWCKGADEPNSGCPGKCAADKPAGEACEDTDECVQGLSCNGGKCAERVKAKAGEDCAGSNSCAAGLACDNESKSVCVALPASGAACLSEKASARCAAGLRCHEGKCAAPGKAGETCDVGAQLETGLQCDAGLNCGVKLSDQGVPESQTCVAIKGAGEACSLIFECKGLDQYCKEGKCASLPKAGEACVDKKVSPFAQCQPTFECDETTSKCAAEPADAKAGESCEKVSCDSGLTCNASNVCEAAAAPVCK